MMTRKKLSGFFCLLLLMVPVLCASAQSRPDPGVAGPYAKCTYRPPAHAGYEEAMVWYPCNSGTARLAATTLTAGYMANYRAISYLADHLVTHGYIVFAMTPNNRYGNNSGWVAAQKAGIAMLRSENSRTGSAGYPNPIRGKVDIHKLQMMGHSKGGGAALIAAADPESGIKTVQALEPYVDIPCNLSKIRARINCIAGSRDSIALPDQVVSIYNSLPDAVDRTLMYFTGMDHMTFTGAGNSIQKSRSLKYITAFMKYHLDGNLSYRSSLYEGEHKKDAGWFYGYAHNMNF